MPINLESFLLALEQEVASYHTPVVDLISVQTRDPFKVLVATILSAKTKDETTSKASSRLFNEASDIHALAGLSEERIRELIHPVGFFKNKAKYLYRLPDALKPYDYRVPAELDELLKLPGVGRKTANLVLSVAFDKPAICVDTHVHRIMNIWGFVNTKNPESTEKALQKILPVKYWKKVNSILVAFGQERCKPVRPQCDCCLFEEDCPKNSMGLAGCRSSRQGCNPVGESPTVSVARVGHVVIPHLGAGNQPSYAWRKRPGCPVVLSNCGGCNLGV